MGDYRVRISVRNARLLRAIEAAGYRPGLAFAQAVGINYNAAVLPYLNLTRSPLNRQGLLRECAWSLCDADTHYPVAGCFHALHVLARHRDHDV